MSCWVVDILGREWKVLQMGWRDNDISHIYLTDCCAYLAPPSGSARECKVLDYLEAQNRQEESRGKRNNVFWDSVCIMTSRACLLHCPHSVLLSE